MHIDRLCVIQILGEGGFKIRDFREAAEGKPFGPWLDSRLFTYHYRNASGDMVLVSVKREEFIRILSSYFGGSHPNASRVVRKEDESKAEGIGQLNKKMMGGLPLAYLLAFATAYQFLTRAASELCTSFPAIPRPTSSH